MQVIFTSDVLADADSWKALDRIMYFFDDSRHIWLIESNEQVDEIESSGWLNGESGSRANRTASEVLIKSYTSYIYRPKDCKIHEKVITVSKTPSAINELTPDDAVIYLNEPAYVLVENEFSDGAFIKAMIYSMKKKSLNDALSNKWLKIEHLGGFGALENKAESIRSQTKGPIRVFIMVDSDRLYTGHEDTGAINKVRKYCGEHPDVIHAILWKRKCENYLPVSVLNRINGKNRKKNYHAFLKLNQEQRDYYEMKHGFSVDKMGNADIPQVQQTLYSKIRSNVLNDLCFGFGHDAWKMFATQKPHISEEEIKMTCSTNPSEINDILDNIERIL